MALRASRPTTGWGRAFEGALEGALSMAIGVVLGYYADRWLGTSPWLLLFFMVVGLIAGVRRLLRIQIPTNTGSPDARENQEIDK